MVEQNHNNSLFSSALRKHLDGDLEEAEMLYRKILVASPDDAQTKHYLGYLLQQTDRLQEAFEQLTGAIALDETHAEWYFNLGIVLLKQNQATAAIDAFCSAIRLDPRKYFYHTNLGTAFELNQEWARAEQCYKAAIDIDPRCPDAFYLLSALYLKLERFDEARHFNYRGIVVAPTGSTSKIVLGQAYYELGRTDDAIALFENWLKDEPDNPVATHMLTAYRGKQTPQQCSREYVEQTFDAFANSFDNVLGRLKYSGPQLVQEYLATLDLPPSSLDVLDLGCGTGLIGERLKPFARLLVGVDLSPVMLERSRARQLYHQLHQSDIADYLRDNGDRYDLIACMDTFTYVGQLEEILELIHQRLKPGGRMLFSTEKLLDTEEHSYKLNISGRYSHHPAYLTDVLSKAGFSILQMQDVTIRTESGYPLEGQFVCAIR